MSEELWGLRQAEVIGTDLFHLDIGLPVITLKEKMERLDGNRHSEFAMAAVNRRGKQIEVIVKINPFLSTTEPAGGHLILIDELAGPESTKDKADTQN